jgi:SAM domain (Sterile alpha motif)
MTEPIQATRNMGFVTGTIARFGLTGKMADDDLVCPLSVSASDHPARCLASMDVGTWLHGLGLGQYEASFRGNEIDADVLPELTDQHLKGPCHANGSAHPVDG